ncbi:MAG: hypothetical protein ACFFCI_19190 [Promethearchaeota archaeon]
MPTDQSKIDEKELRALNLFFGIIIVLLSIFAMILFFIANDIAQMIILSISLLIVGVTLTGIGIPNKYQTVAAAVIEIIFGYVVTGGGLIFLFISLISSNSILLFITINAIFAFAGFAGIFAPLSEDRSKTWSKYIMAGFGGLIMLFFSVFNIIFLLFELVDPLVAKILMFIILLSYGLARIIIFKIGIFQEKYLEK